jgi:hypothetical protein
MTRGRFSSAVAATTVAVVASAIALGAPAAPAATTVDATASQLATTVSPQFLSFGIDASQLLTRDGKPPFDFTRARLRTLTAPLAPAVIRLSGTKIDQTYIDLSGADPPTIPAGYKYGITRDELDRAAAFAKSLGLGLDLGLNAGPGPRTLAGAWDPAAATALLQYAAAHGFPVRATTFGNEPNITYYGSGMPATYTAAAYAAEAKQAAALSRQILPQAEVVGPGSFFSTGAEKPLNGANLGPDTAAIMPLAKNLYDAVSYHSYPAFASTCAAPIKPLLPADTLSAEFLDRVNGPLAYMSKLRDANDPGKPLWVDESGNAACGGVVGYSDRFAASFYYMNFLGTLARGGVKVAIRWTLAGPASQPYSLIDDATLTPRPDYWAAVLWHRLMGTTVLTPKTTTPSPTVRTFAQCTPNVRGGVTTLALNTNRTAPADLALAGTGATGAGAYLVTGALGATQPALNGTPLAVAADGSLPTLTPKAVTGGHLTLPPASYAFVTEPQAASGPCGAPATSVTLKAPRQKLATVARKRAIAASCRLPAPGTCTIDATITAATAKRLGLKPRKHARTFPLGARTTKVTTTKTKTTTVKLSRATARRLARSRRAVKITLVATSAIAGRQPGTRTASVTLRR